MLFYRNKANKFCWVYSPFLILLTSMLIGCAFDFTPSIEPLVLPTIGSNQGIQSLDITTPSLSSALSIKMSDPSIKSFTTWSKVPINLLWAIIGSWIPALLAAAALFRSLKKEEDNPNLIALIITGLLLTVAIVLVEVLFVIVEAILAGPDFTGNPFAIVLSIVVVVLGLFLINLEVAYWVYVYRVTKALPGEKIPFDLTPLDWGLRK